jgi:hypothetical protein
LLKFREQNSKNFDYSEVKINTRVKRVLQGLKKEIKKSRIVPGFL